MHFSLFFAIKHSAVFRQIASRRYIGIGSSQTVTAEICVISTHCHHDLPWCVLLDKTCTPSALLEKHQQNIYCQQGLIPIPLDAHLPMDPKNKWKHLCRGKTMVYFGFSWVLRWPQARKEYVFKDSRFSPQYNKSWFHCLRRPCSSTFFVVVVVKIRSLLFGKILPQTLSLVLHSGLVCF